MTRRKTKASVLAEESAAAIEERRIERLKRSRPVLEAHKVRWLKRIADGERRAG